MTTTIPQFSPGCFGSALAFKRDDVACSGCQFAKECEPMHLEAQRALRERYGIKPSHEMVLEREEAKRRERQEATVDPAALSLPAKTRELLARLDRGQYDVVGKLQRGENPFGSAIPFMRIACHLLLRLGRPLSADGLTTAFTSHLGWQENTAKAHARMAIQALTHVGAVENNDGMITIRKA